MLRDSKYVTFCKRQNYEDSKKISVFQGLGRREGWKGGAWGVFRAVKSLFVIP